MLYTTVTVMAMQEINPELFDENNEALFTLYEDGTLCDEHDDQVAFNLDWDYYSCAYGGHIRDTDNA